MPRNFILPSATWRAAAFLLAVLPGAAPADTAGPSRNAYYEFVRLGSGACRTAQNTAGNFYRMSAVSLRACQDLCSEAIGHGDRCYGIEYDRASKVCELHTKKLSHATGSGGTLVCYRTRLHTICPKCD